MLMSFLAMFVMLALWLAGLFFLVGVIWLLVRKLNRIERIVRQLVPQVTPTLEEDSDRPFLKKLVVAYVATLVVLSAGMTVMMALPAGVSVGTSDSVPAQLERP